MIRFGLRVGVSCWVISFVVGEVAAQTPTMSLRPSTAFTRKCTGGPEHGAGCTATADCERDGTGAVHPECERTCDIGDNAGEACTTPADCPGGGRCIQSCFCNYWVTNPPLVLGVEIRGRNWSPNNQELKSFQASVDLAPACSAVLPFGWDRPCESIPCDPDNPNCPQAFPICNEDDEVCEGNNHNPGDGALIDSNAACYVFRGMTELKAVDVSTLKYRFASVLLTAAGVPFSVEKCFGTLTLQPRSFPLGCGEVSINLTSPNDSQLSDQFSNSIVPLDLEGLTIVFSQNCPCNQIKLGEGSSIPARCTIDPRQPSEPDGSAPAGWTTAVLDLNCENTFLSEEDFSLREVPGTATFPPDTVENNTPEPGMVTLTFPPTTPGVWTCIRRGVHAASEVCLGTLPGDTDESGVVQAADLTTLVDCLTASPQEACELRQCDMDRSGTCGAGDLVRAVDLLGGANSYSPGWEGELLPVCPNPP